MKQAGCTAIYTNSAAYARYAFNRLARNAFDQVQQFVNEETGALDCANLNTFSKPRKMAYNDSDRVRSVAKEI